MSQYHHLAKLKLKGFCVSKKKLERSSRFFFSRHSLALIKSMLLEFFSLLLAANFFRAIEMLVEISVTFSFLPGTKMSFATCIGYSFTAAMGQLQLRK